MAKKKTWFLVGAMALLTACGTPSDADTDALPETRAQPSVSVVGDTTFLELPLGTSASNGEISVRFDAVTTDSRCPTGVQCVWEGNAGIRLTVTNRDDTEVYVVNSVSTPTRVRFVGWTIGFRDLAPYPSSTTPPDPSAYVATILILDTRGEVPAASAEPATADEPVALPREPID